MILPNSTLFMPPKNKIFMFKFLSLINWFNFKIISNRAQLSCLISISFFLIGHFLKKFN